jgi:uncharacterized protein
MIHITKNELNIVKDLLNKYNFKNVFVFGSRATGKQTKYSDLDILIKENAKDSDLYQLEEDLKESDLPFKVDVVLWRRCNSNFQEKIQKQMIPLKL